MMSHFLVSEAIICYDCNSADDPNCGDPFNDYSLGTVNCSLRQRPTNLPPDVKEATLCRKTTQKGKSFKIKINFWSINMLFWISICSVYGVTRVVRGCGYIRDERDDKDCVKRSGTHDVQALYCACSTEKCNNGPTIQPHIAMILMLGGVTSLYAFFIRRQ